MTCPAAIAGQLAGYQSLADGTLRLRIDVQREQAPEAVAALFGDGVGQMVAVARLNEMPNGQAPGGGHRARRDNSASVPALASSEEQPRVPADGILSPLPVAAGKPSRRWADVPPAEQAGIRCAEPGFRDWIWDKHHMPVATAEVAAAWVRTECCVASRAELNTNHKARVIWHQLDAEYQAATGRIAEARG